MIIKNVQIYTPMHEFRRGAVSVYRGIIQKICYYDDGNEICLPDYDNEEIDGDGKYLIPGLIDMHFHGCCGSDVCDGTIDAWKKISEYQLSIGVTSICPATMTLEAEQLKHILRVADSYRKLENTKGAELIGINMEGPFISKDKKGAQAEEYILPCNVDLAEEFLKESGGLVKVLGISPEDDESIEFVRTMKDKVVLSLAHTNADYEHASAAIDAGVRHVVHLYNAMTPMTHRKPGVVGAAADSDGVTVELICDGIHVHPAVIRNTFRLFSEERIILISDSMRATGLTDGIYTLGGQDVNVEGKCATLLSDGALAGSVTTLPDCIRTVVNQMGIPLETAIRCSTENPAKRLNVWNDLGSIEEGKRADFLLLDADLELIAVIKNGIMAE